MGQPQGPTEGGIEVGVTVNTRGLTEEFRDGLDRTERRTRRDQEEFGERVGVNINRGFRRNAFRDMSGFFSGVLTAGVLRQRRRYRGIGASITHFIAEGFQAEASSLKQTFAGILSGLGAVVGPIFGSLLNIGGSGGSGGGGKAKLAFIILIIGDLIGLILALIHGVHALMSLLAAVPNLLFAIGLQGAALIFIFNGFFEAVGQLSAAKNIGELNTALKGTNKEMADIVKALFPFKQLFHDVSEAAKTSFFGSFGVETVNKLFDALNRNGVLLNTMSMIAGALGSAFATIVNFFSSSQFTDFMQLMGQQVVVWLNAFGPAVAKFLQGLTTFGTATLPYVQWFGEKFNGMIEGIGRWFEKLANPDSGFLDWLERAKHTISLFFDTLGAIYATLKTIWTTLDKEGIGDQLLSHITDIFKALAWLFNTKLGERAMREIVDLVTALLWFTGVLIVAITIILALLGWLQDGIIWVFEGLHDGFVLIGMMIMWVVEHVRKWFSDGEEAVSGSGRRIYAFFQEIGTNISTFFSNLGTNILTFLQSIPTMLGTWLSNADTWLYEGGKKLINGLINGIKDSIPSLSGVLDAVKNKAKSFFGVGDGGGGGEGAAAAAGGSMVLANAAGAIQMQNPALATTNNNNGSNVNVASGAVQINFNSTNPPTQQQAAAAGKSASAEYLKGVTALQMRTA